MKEILKPCTLLFMLLFGFCFSFSAQAANTYNLNQPSGTISVLGNSYVNSMNETWVINVGNARPVRINYIIDVENTHDKVLIIAVNADNSTTLVTILTGTNNGTISTAIPSGKVLVVFTSDGSVCSASGYAGFNLDFSIESGTSTYTSGNSIINGKLGVGFLAPKEKIHVNGSIRGSLTGGALNVKTDYGYLQLGPQNVNYTDFITDKNYFQFNKPIYLTSGLSSTSTSNNLNFQIGGTPKMTLLSNGYFGIGTPSPSAKLDVRDGSIFLTDADVVHGMSGYYLENNFGILGPISGTAGGLNIYGISDIDAVGLQLNGTIGSATPAATTPAIMFNTNKKNGTTVQALGAADIAFRLDNSATPLMTVLGNGNVGIGTTAPDKLFTVKGIIHAQEVQVDVTGFADYVFEKGYKLKPLSEIHSFISENGHLPEIPSEDEVKKNGMNVADMQVMLLKKIEELTLYAIEQQKRIEALENTLKEK